MYIGDPHNKITSQVDHKNLDETALSQNWSTERDEVIFEISKTFKTRETSL